MQVLKFGGSSVADATRMSQVLDIVLAAAAKDRVILVSSAVSGCTDALLAIGGESDPAAKAQQIEALRRCGLGVHGRVSSDRPVNAVDRCRFGLNDFAAALEGHRQRQDLVVLDRGGVGKACLQVFHKPI